MGEREDADIEEDIEVDDLQPTPRPAPIEPTGPGFLARAWARSAALRMAPPPPPKPPEPEAPRWSAEQLEEARRDPAALCAFVLRDEKGRPVTNAPHHIEIHGACSAHRRLCVRGFAESGKTTAMVGRVLWELGHNPNLRVCILSEATDRAKELVSLISQYVTESEELHAVFPGLRPARRDADPLKKLKGRHVKWSMASFTVERSARLRDPSVRATGYGKPIQGARIDLLVIDDLITFETSLTERARKKLERWVRSGISGRLTNESRVWLLNTAYHPKDLGCVFRRKDGYAEVRIPARDPATGESRWPEKWSAVQLALRIKDLGGEGAVETARQVDALDRDESSSNFKDEWFNKALAGGADVTPIERWPSDKALPADAFFVGGVDVGLGKKTTNAESVITTLLCFPSGAPEWGYLPGLYQLAWIEAGRWDGPELLEKIYDTADRFQGIVLFVEDAQAQRWATQFKIPGRKPPTVLPFQTGSNKWNPAHGVASLGIDMAAGLVVLPNDDGSVVEQMAALIEELKTFAVGEHTGDRHMSFWIAREGMRMITAGTGGSVEVLG